MSFRLPARPLIYFITDGTLSTENYAAVSETTLGNAEAAIRNGISLIQIREKSLPARLVFDLAVRLKRIARGTSARILINERADIAAAAGVDGVHLTATSPPTEVIRRSFGRDFLIGISTHSVGEILAAKTDGADFAVYGPVFKTPGKGAPVGIDGLRNAVKQSRGLPLIALGGVDETNYRDVLSVADGFAAIRFLNDRALLSEMTF